MPPDRRTPRTADGPPGLPGAPRLSPPDGSRIARCRAIAAHGRRCRRAPVAGAELCAPHIRQVARAAQARARAGG